MGLPRQEFFSLEELALRWTAQRHQIGQWAASGLLELVTSIAPVDAAGEELAGIVVVCAADLLPMFRRDGSGPDCMRLRRLKLRGEQQWRTIKPPEEGVLVCLADLVVSAQEAARFEAEHEVFGRPHGGKGPELKYDWDEFWRAVALRVHDRGVPGTLKEFTEEFSLWFMDRSPTGEIPSDSVIRKRLSPLWNELRRESNG